MLVFSALALVLVTSTLWLIVKFFRSTTPRQRFWSIVVFAVVLGGLVPALVVVEHSLPTGSTWKAASWRARLFTKKTEGGGRDLSWREPWLIARSTCGFRLAAFFHPVPA